MCAYFENFSLEDATAILTFPFICRLTIWKLPPLNTSLPIHHIKKSTLFLKGTYLFTYEDPRSGRHYS